MPSQKQQHTIKHVGECLYRSEESKIYYAIIKRNGKQIKRSLKTTDKALAKRRLDELQGKADKLSTRQGTPLTFDELAATWLTSIKHSSKASSYHRQEGIVQQLSKYFGPTPARSISVANAEKWAASRGAQVSARTYNYERETLIRILNHAREQGTILDNPASTLKRRKSTKKLPVIPTKEQFRLMVSTIRALRKDAAPSADLCELLAYSGCRLGEAIAIQWKHVDFENKRLTITGGETGTKNHEWRTIPLFPALANLLKRLHNETKPDDDQKVIPLRSAKKAMTSACTKAELPPFTHHHLRHFFCSNAIEQGIDFKTIAAWLGHKDGGLLVAKTYGHLRDEHSARMAKRMTFEA